MTEGVCKIMQKVVLKQGVHSTLWHGIPCHAIAKTVNNLT